MSFQVEGRGGVAEEDAAEADNGGCDEQVDDGHVGVDPGEVAKREATGVDVEVLVEVEGAEDEGVELDG